MKKITIAFISIVLTFCLTGCSIISFEDILNDINLSSVTANINDEDTHSFTPVYTTTDYFETLDFYDNNTQETIYYLLHKPIRKTKKPMPLVIFLHGLGDSVSATYTGTAEPMVSSLMTLENESHEYSTYTLVPSTPLANEGNWTYTQIIAFKTLIKNIIKQYNIDADRVYISGISMGGFMTCELVSLMPNTFAAAVPLSGAQKLLDPQSAHNTAFRIYHVRIDTVVDVSCSRFLNKQLRDSNHPNVEYFEYREGDHISPLYTVFKENRDEFFSWLFSQRRNNSK
ncbi:MAG: prolyl oligopeptidase family serine peptidase [Clostridia bacterium]|nr:prolyl oligopeptidase family serine peptidase [Clostridia bacterium]